MMITLATKSSQAAINPNGAWVEELSHDGKPLFFPRTELMSDSGDRKARGGMHVCLPNFGPGGDTGLAQHGFGRTSEWSITAQDDTSATLILKGQEIRYAGLVCTVNYELTDTSFTSTLAFKNDGRTSFRIAPGFHPYFYLNESETAVSVDDTVYELPDLAGTEFLQTDTLTLRTSGRSITITQQGLPTWAIWTDGLANYVCAEPTSGGYRFLELSNPEEMLNPGDERTFSCTISW